MSANRNINADSIISIEATPMLMTSKSGVAENESGQFINITAGNATADNGTGFGGELRLTAGTDSFQNQPAIIALGGPTDSTRILMVGPLVGDSADLTALILRNGSLKITEAGQGVWVKEGSNAKQGVATLVAGTVVVSNTSVNANSRILLTCQDPNGGVPGAVYISSRTASTSFTITSTSVADTGIVAYEIFEPA